MVFMSVSDRKTLAYDEDMKRYIQVKITNEISDWSSGVRDSKSVGIEPKVCSKEGFNRTDSMLQKYNDLIGASN